MPTAAVRSNIRTAGLRACHRFCGCFRAITPTLAAEYGSWAKARSPTKIPIQNAKIVAFWIQTLVVLASVNHLMESNGGVKPAVRVLALSSVFVFSIAKANSRYGRSCFCASSRNALMSCASVSSDAVCRECSTTFCKDRTCSGQEAGR